MWTIIFGFILSVTLVLMDEPRDGRTIDKILVMFKPTKSESSVSRNNTVYYKIVPKNEIVSSTVKDKVNHETETEDFQSKHVEINKELVMKKKLEKAKIMTLTSSKLTENKTIANITDTIANEPPVKNTTIVDITSETDKGEDEDTEESKGPEQIITNDSLGTDDNNAISLNFIQALLAEGDPGLVKVLLNNSTSDNLNVFLDNSNVTVDELKDFIDV